MASPKKEGDHESKPSKHFSVNEEGQRFWKGIPIEEVDPYDVFKDSSSDLERYGEDTPSSSEATFTWSRPGYRGYRGCWLNEEGDYVGYDDGSLVIYNGSLDSDSGWNRQFCKRVKPKKESSDEDEVSSHPPTKKAKCDSPATHPKSDGPTQKSNASGSV